MRSSKSLFRGVLGDYVFIEALLFFSLDFMQDHSVFICISCTFGVIWVFEGVSLVSVISLCNRASLHNNDIVSAAINTASDLSSLHVFFFPATIIITTCCC